MKSASGSDGRLLRRAPAAAACLVGRITTRPPENVHGAALPWTLPLLPLIFPQKTGGRVSVSLYCFFL